MRSTKLPLWIERLLGLDPRPVPPHVFALGGQELRYGRFERAADGLALATYQARPLPPDLFGPGLLGPALRDAASLTSIVRELAESVTPPPTDASLIVPDDWLRLSFTELSEIPANPKTRDEVLRFKLKRQVPFRVEDLRISAAEAAPLPQQEESLRLLLGFALESLIAHIEEAFTAAGIRLGHVTNETLALLSGLEPRLARGDLAALVLVQPDAYTLSVARGGDLLLVRHNAHGAELPEGVHGSAVRRDLRLTIGFLREHLGEAPLARVLLAAPPELEPRWLDWLQGELAATPEPLAREHFPLTAEQADLAWPIAGPMLGAASIEVA